MLVSLAEDITDITSDLRGVNKFEGSRIELTEKFMYYIQLYSDAKQLREIRFFLELRFFL